MIRGASLLFLVACAGAPSGEAPATAEPGAWFLGDLPVGFPVPRVPEDNPMSDGKAELGRFLFYDKRLSANGTQACAGCHLQHLAFTDGLPRGIGSTGEVLPRNSMGLTNVAYATTLTWANPALVRLEDQVLVPMFGEHPIELGITGNEAEVLAALHADPRYADLVSAAWPGETRLDFDRVARALAAFLRTLISGDSPFDRFTFQGDDDAMSPAALRGMDLFFSERLECHHCHGGFNLSQATAHAGTAIPETPFHNTGLYDVDGLGSYPAENTGLHAITGLQSDMGRFKPPSLRNVAVTAPYMHDGSIGTLEEVLAHYEAGGRLITEGPTAGDGRLNPYKNGFVQGFVITEEERADVLAFLHSLTDEGFLTRPALADPFAP